MAAPAAGAMRRTANHAGQTDRAAPSVCSGTRQRLRPGRRDVALPDHNLATGTAARAASQSAPCACSVRRIACGMPRMECNHAGNLCIACDVQCTLGTTCSAHQCNIQRRSLYRAHLLHAIRSDCRSLQRHHTVFTATSAPGLHRHLGPPLPHLRRDCADLLFQEDQIGAVVTKMAQFHKRVMDTYR